MLARKRGRTLESQSEEWRGRRVCRTWKPRNEVRLAWDRSVGFRVSEEFGEEKRIEAHGLAVEEVILVEDGGDGCWVLESEESESTGTSRLGVAHDSRMSDFAELLKVGSQRFCLTVQRDQQQLDEVSVPQRTVGSVPVESSYEHLAVSAEGENMAEVETGHSQRRARHVHGREIEERSCKFDQLAALRLKTDQSCIERMRRGELKICNAASVRLRRLLGQCETSLMETRSAVYEILYSDAAPSLSQSDRGLSFERTTREVSRSASPLSWAARGLASNHIAL